jgi:hypothetical protein
MDLIRGDTATVKFPITYKDGSNVELEDIDTIYVTFKKNTYTKDFVFQKDLQQIKRNEDGLYCFTIEPKDTETLPYGDYAFDIEVTLKNGYRKTKLENLRLENETTFHGGDEDGN